MLATTPAFPLGQLGQAPQLSLSAPHESLGCDTEQGSEGDERPKGGSAQPALEETGIGPIDPGIDSQLLLAEASRLASGLQDEAEGDRDAFSHLALSASTIVT